MLRHALGALFLLAATVATAASLPKDLPKLPGDTYVADLSNPRTAALWNLNHGILTLYVYDRDSKELQPLYAVKYDAVRHGDSTDIRIPVRGLAFSIEVDRDANLLLDGNRTKLALLDANRPVPGRAVREAVCDDDSTASTVTTNAGKLTAKPQSIYCLWGLAYGDCCGSCFCVHRDLGLPEWVDNICCGGGC